ncbi:class D sortase [uncultured Exiguobacterium sp.]|uniref:class D sortase n=1 Tax=uncultured Exiguobacterium sp. TaxID=202669 RepID=UPI0025DE205F|nr:class D sortase [uncultured Exiguobacterium sp.]
MIRRLSTMLLVIGFALLGYVGYQKLTVQQTLTTELAKAKDVVQAEGTSSTTSKTDDTSKRSKQKTEDVLFQTGETVGYLEVPSLEMELPILEGVDDATLAKGVGHHPETAFPGQGDRIFLAGHNDTTFSKISKLKKGDEIVLYLANGSYRYVMQSSEIVDYKDTRVLESTKRESLVVSTCYPFYNVTDSTERYLIYFEPVEEDAS